MRKKYCWLAENKWLKAQANRLSVAEERGGKPVQETEFDLQSGINARPLFPGEMLGPESLGSVAPCT
jgi:hypothetical protein